MQHNTNNSNKWIDWIENSITEGLIKFYDSNQFGEVEEIGPGTLGKLYRTTWKNSSEILALKSFYNFDETIAREIVNEVIII